MMLLITSSNPIIAASQVPDKLKFKQLLELCQMFCSLGYSDIYKPVKQGKEVQKWISKNKTWCQLYADWLYFWCLSHINMKVKTKNDIKEIIQQESTYKFIISNNKIPHAKTAIFRYVNTYKCKYKTNTELPINEAIVEYKAYIKWKENKTLHKI